MVYESVVEESTIALLQKQGYELAEPDSSGWFSTRNLDDFINVELLESCLLKINSVKERRIIEEAVKTIQRIDNPSLFERNYQFHMMLIEGITVEDKDYAVNPLIKLVDFEHPENNVFQVTHQIKFREGHDTGIPDVIVYINGIPLIVMELKTFDENGTNATLHHAYMQLGEIQKRVVTVLISRLCLTITRSW